MIADTVVRRPGGCSARSIGCKADLARKHLHIRVHRLAVEHGAVARRCRVTIDLERASGHTTSATAVPLLGDAGMSPTHVLRHPNVGPSRALDGGASLALPFYLRQACVSGPARRARLLYQSCVRRPAQSGTLPRSLRGVLRLERALVRRHGRVVVVGETLGLAGATTGCTTEHPPDSHREHGHSSFIGVRGCFPHQPTGDSSQRSMERPSARDGGWRRSRGVTGGLLRAQRRVGSRGCRPAALPRAADAATRSEHLSVRTPLRTAVTAPIGDGWHQVVRSERARPVQHVVPFEARRRFASTQPQP